MAFAGFAVQVDDNVDALYDEATSGGNGKFPPLPAGRYQANVVPLKKDGSQLIEVVDFANGGANAGKKAVRVAVRVVDESPTGAKRTFFVRIPLFTSFASGKPARNYFDFFGAVGASPEQLKAGQVPGPDDFLGKQITIVVSDPKEPDEYNPLGSNEVSFYSPAEAITSTPVRKPGIPVAKWLDENDDLLPAYTAGQGAAPAAGGQSSWAPGAAPAAASGNPWGNAPAGAPAGGAAGNPWAASQGESGLQAAAAAGGPSF